MKYPFVRLAAIALLALFFSTSLIRVHAAEATPAAANRFELPATDDGLPGSGPLRRYDWFRNLWRERRTAWSRRIGSDQNALVFLGDSITQSWGDSIGNMFPGIKVANRGISGDTTRGVLIRLAEDVLALNPRGIVLLIGTNDLEEQAEPETIAANMKLILAAFKEHNPAMPVILCNVMPSSTTKKRPAEKIRKINQLYFALVHDHPQVTVLDTFTLFATQHGDAKPDEFPDLLHPNGIGYHKWEAALRPVLETTGLLPAWLDDLTPESGFKSLFNGRDLTGWSYTDSPALDGKHATGDGRFLAKNGRLITTGARTARNSQRLATTRKLPKDFVLKLEFRASPNATSGIFIREPQLACGDYLLAGPYMNLKNYRPLDWNEIVITARDGLAHCTCNGEVLIDAMPLSSDGPIGLESNRGQVEYRRIRIKELPSR